MHASSGHIDHATIAQFRQGDFVDQTQHVKNASISACWPSWHEIPNDWDQGVFSESNWLYNEEKKRMMGITTDAAAVPDGERKEN